MGVGVINTLEAVGWGDLRGIFGFTVSELTDKCPYMAAFCSTPMC